MTLGSLRKQIDKIDGRLLVLLNQRADLSVKAGQIKKETKVPLVDRGREARLLYRLSHKNKGPLSDSSIRKIFREILQQSRKLQSARLRSRKR